MPPFCFLIAESEAPEEREARRESAGRSSGESYAAAVLALVPGSSCDLVKPAEEGALWSPAGLAGYDAVFLCGSPMHVYEETPEVLRVLRFMRAVFASGAPSFGSCAGLQVAVAAAGGVVGARAAGQEAGFARRIAPTAAGRGHRMLDGRPLAYDAAAIHSDEVKALPAGATLLASNGASVVQAAEVRLGEGVFWGVQYHPELPLSEIAQALRRQAGSLVESGLAADRAAALAYADRVAALAEAPERRDLAWQLGLDEQVTDPALRQLELRNFIEHMAAPRRARRLEPASAA